MWVYIQSAEYPPLYTVGHYDPSGRWHPDSDHANREEAAKRVNYLNGSTELEETIDALLTRARREQPRL